MKLETTEWIDKAEGDWTVAQREMQASNPVGNVVCFLAQQCAEKCLKALLEEHNIAFGKTHDLVVLLNSSGALLPELHSQRPSLAHLGTFGIDSISRRAGGPAGCRRLDENSRQRASRSAGEAPTSMNRAEGRHQSAC